MSRLIFTERAWDEYLYWQTQDKKTLKRINQLLKDIERNGNNGIGKSEPLRFRDGWRHIRVHHLHLLVVFFLVDRL